jgi:hypothetical protein
LPNGIMECEHKSTFCEEGNFADEWFCNIVVHIGTVIILTSFALQTFSFI